jgi:tetratricopeptide (TPR) repeat protein
MKQKKQIRLSLILAIGLGLINWTACGAKPQNQDRAQKYYLEAHAFMEKNQPDKAIPLYKKVLKEKNDFAQAYHEIAVCYQQVGNDSAAIDNYEGAIVFNTRDVDAYQSVGNIYFMQKVYDEALTWYEKASDVDILYPRSYNNMATIWYMRQNYDMAKRYWDKAIAVDATYPRAYYGLGLVAFITGDTTEAEAKFLDAVKVASMPEAIYMLGKLNYDKGQYDQAESWLNRYLEKEPNGEWAEKSRDMLVLIGQKKAQGK